MKESSTEFRGKEIRYRIGGNENGETVMMLHPAFADHSIFEEQVEALRERFRLILIDLPGHGADGVAASVATLKEFPAICARILVENEIEACHLLGVSLGSLVAQAIASAAPERVRSVTVVGGYSIHKEYDEVLKKQKEEGLKWLGFFLLPFSRFRRYAASVSCRTDRGQALFARGARHFRRRSFAAMSGIDTYFVPVAEPVPYPLLIVVGTHDIELARESAEQLHRLEPRSRLETIAGAGHCANADRPEAFNRVYLGFLAGV